MMLLARGVLVGLLTALVVVVSWAAAVAVFLATAMVTDVVGVLFAASVVAAALVALSGGWLVARLLPRRFTRRYAGGVGLTALVLLVVLASLTVLRPLPGTAADRREAPPPGVRYWRLSTGSRLAYVEVPATGTPRSTPIVLVGGGPGEADVGDRDQVRFFGRFARLGYDVYAYDQLGAGLSNRLADPAAYMVKRHVADLEAIRIRIGAKRMILMGSSWGGSLVASYLARYPRHVARAVLTSPAPMDYGKWQNAGSPAARLPKEQRRTADRLFPGSPRFALWYALGVVNPRAAHGLVSDHEADAYFDHYLDLVRPATVCDPAHLPPARTTGNGFYDNVFTTRSAASGGQAHVPSRLATVHTPTLIVTGGCNYVPWAATRQYATTLPDATLVCFPHAGHVVYLDDPHGYEATIRSFLHGTRLPERAWPTTRPCTA